MAKKSKKRLILLDAHAIIHRAYHALPDFTTSSGEPTGGLYGLCAMLMKIIADLKPDYIVAAYDLPKPTYRHEAYDGYKGGRAKIDDALISQLKRSRDIFKAFSVPIYDKEGFEADDILGTIVENLKDEKGVEIIVASGDMDTLQLVKGKKVQVYTLRKGIQDTILYDEKKVKERFGFGPELLPDYKGLRGDPSDNIIGIAGIGDKTASILIQNFGSVEEMYKELEKGDRGEENLKKAGLTPRIVELLKKGKEEAQFSKMLATIRRDAPIDFYLPQNTWIETVDVKMAEGLFTVLQFRSMGGRLKEVLKKMTGGDLPEEKSPVEEYDPRALKEAAIGLWLLNSTITNPAYDDVLKFTNSKNLKEAGEKIFRDIKEKNLEKVWNEIEKPLIPVVEKMEKSGIKLNTQFLQNLSEEKHKELEILEKKIWEYAGGEFNINSPKQMGEILFGKMGLKAKNQKKTAGGALSTKESELIKLQDVHPVIGEILKYRELAKLLNTYIDAMPRAVNSGGRIHAKFLQAGTTTGRMASEDPNLQNIPNRSDLGKKIREAFVAEKGFKMVAFDYSQAELRIAAFLSPDERLIEIFKRGEDVHSSVASFVFGVPLGEVDKEMRRKAKVINFGIIYGMGVSALQKNLGGSRAEAENFYNNYFAVFSGLASYLRKVKEETGKRGYTETFFGRRRYFEGFKSPLPYVRAEAERMAINAPIQGTEADIVKLAMARVDEYLKKNNLEDKVFPLLQVHDELVYEIEEGLVEKISPEIKKIMENVIMPEKTRGVVLKVDVSVGENWGRMQKVTDNFLHR